MSNRWRRLGGATLAVLLIPVGLGRLPAALACSCVHGGGYEDDVARADAVFDGTVTERIDPSPSPAPAGTVTWRFDVSNVLKGSVTDPQDVRSFREPNICGASFAIGAAYRVFARREGSGLTTSLCSPNRALLGYRLAAADGGVFAFGSSTFHGSAGGLPLNAPVVGIASTPSGRGYWLAAADGGVFAYGDARFFGSAGGGPLNARIVGITASPTGGGYWLAAADGGVFAYGDAGFAGSAAGLPLNAPVVGIAASSRGGYWLLGTDGGIFAYGGAGYFGRPTLGARAGGAQAAATSATSPPFIRRATGITASHSGNGYWVATNHNLPAGFGDITPMGGLFATGISGDLDIALTRDTPALVVANAAGEVFVYNQAPLGSLVGVRLRAPVVAVSS